MLLSAGCARSETQSPAQILETANALAAQGDLGGAIRTLQDALATAPDNIELRRLEARLHLRNGDAAAGEASLRQLLARGVPSEQLLEDLGDALLAQKKYWEALELAKSTQGSTPLAQLQADLLGLRAQAALPDRDDRRIVRAVAEFARRRESAGADASGG
ncbi:MAG TPA: tetratricopeptide repeat protein, partial [Steroidobacteraceae bacterium]